VPLKTVGRNVRRKDGDAKVTGAATYIDDMTFPDMLYGTTIRTTIPCGEIVERHVDLPEADGYVVADHRDIPGRNIVALIADDQPCLAEREVRHVAEPVLLVAHADPEKLLDAHARVRLEYRAGEPVIDPARSAHSFKDIAIDKGDIAAGFAAAHTIVEGEYRTGHQEQLYIETNGVIAVPGGPRPAAPAGEEPVDGIGGDGGEDFLPPPLVPIRCGSCRPRPAAVSAARRNTRRSSPATPPSSPSSRSGR
jgi:CO/xanthine dehydrogenase Mo-binding subunit